MVVDFVKEGGYMKRILSLLLMLTCLLLPVASVAQGFQLPGIVLPDSTVFSATFAAQAVTLCQTQPQLLAMMGLKQVFQGNAGKDEADASHTSAYAVYQTTVTYKGEPRVLLIVVIQGTQGGEWYSNFDFAPSRDNETQYAENFYAATQDIYAGIQPVFAQAENPLVVVTGYSRGAACANLLGMLLNQDYGVENVFVYTAATPNTVRGEVAQTECPNIFNIVNPCDLVTHMPLAAWGYTRLGQDIVLPADAAELQQVEAVLAQMAAMVPDIQSYYTVKLNLMGAGESPFGLTTYEAMVRLADMLIGKADPATVAVMQRLSPDSSLTPILQFFTAAPDNPLSLMNQHAPMTYAQLFEQLQNQP